MTTNSPASTSRVHCGFHSAWSSGERRANSSHAAKARKGRENRRIDLGEGVWTAPNHFLGDYPGFKFRRFAHALPADLTGKSVLDIGCNAGFYSVEMKRRGAARVLGLDSDERYLAQGRFVAERLGHDIEFRNLSVYDVGRLGERFDVVIDRPSGTFSGCRSTRRTGPSRTRLVRAAACSSAGSCRPEACRR